MYRWFETRIDAFPDAPPVRPPDTLWAFYAHFIKPVWPAFALLLVAGGVGIEFLVWATGFGAVLTNTFGRWQARRAMRASPTAIQ